MRRSKVPSPKVQSRGTGSADLGPRTLDLGPLQSPRIASRNPSGGRSNRAPNPVRWSRPSGMDDAGANAEAPAALGQGEDQVHVLAERPGTRGEATYIPLRLMDSTSPESRSSPQLQRWRELRGGRGGNTLIGRRSGHLARPHDVGLAGRLIVAESRGGLSARRYRRARLEGGEQVLLELLEEPGRRLDVPPAVEGDLPQPARPVVRARPRSRPCRAPWGSRPRRPCTRSPGSTCATRRRSDSTSSRSVWGFKA